MPNEIVSPVVLTEKVSFSYDGQPVLEDVNLRVNDKDFIWVVGPNGGGKTTLIKLLLGLLRPGSGTIKIFGRSPQEVITRIGYMAQTVDLDWQYPLAVMDLALMGRLQNRSFGLVSKQDRMVVDRVLTEVGLTDYARRSFSALSGGQRRKLLIARALASEPHLLILDEPTANLDRGATHDLYRLLEGLNQKLTVIMVSHDPTYVSEFVKRVICVNRHVHEHPTSKIDGEYLRHLYGGEVRMVQHDRELPEGD
jgi:zinc transport system ATP-binding protein